MKKIILLLSALMLITTISFSQRNYRAGELDVSKDATFKKSITVESENVGISFSAMSSYSGAAFIIFDFDGTLQNEVLIPQVVTLHGGSCEGTTAFVATMTNTGTTCTFWLTQGDITECTDFTGVSLLFKRNGNLSVQGGSNIMGRSAFSDGYKFLFEAPFDGPMHTSGTQAEILDGDVREKYAEATHIFYPEINQWPSGYYGIDSITYDTQWDQTMIWSHTAPIGQLASIHYGEVYKFIGGRGDLTIANSLAIGRFPQNADFAVDGTADFSGVVRLNYINDFDSTDWNYSSEWVSGDSILGNYEYPNLAAQYCKGDIIAKADGSWSATIKTIEFGDFHHLNELGGHNTLITHDGTDPGVSSGTFRVYKNPDLIIGGGVKCDIAPGVFISAFRGSTDTDITGWIMTNANGDTCYMYPNSAGNGITVSTIKP